MPKKVFNHSLLFGLWCALGQVLWEQSHKIPQPCDICQNPHRDNARTKWRLTASAGCYTAIVSYASLKMAASQLVHAVWRGEALLRRVVTRKCQLARRTVAKPAGAELVLRILKKQLTVATASSKARHHCSPMGVPIVCYLFLHLFTEGS